MLTRRKRSSGSSAQVRSRRSQRVQGVFVSLLCKWIFALLFTAYIVMRTATLQSLSLLYSVHAHNPDTTHTYPRFRLQQTSQNIFTSTKMDKHNSFHSFQAFEGHVHNTTPHLSQMIQKTCKGNGAIDCFKPEWAVGFQFGFCPFPVGIAQPSMYQNPLSPPRSKTPVLYTGALSSVCYSGLPEIVWLQCSPCSPPKYHVPCTSEAGSGYQVLQ